ncbi:ferredoxin--NADP reductase [Mucilaginibacter limnophilus]|uniref:Ferredoxin--NADP reductase n=1 Tax=Mucilaginibacter limnophilus TaxID=1932778 RepID=A0A3S2V8W2_9SPHI|nr:ferredoxin--NADP reductase [Mucilaginibacter limnophilus]RVU01484.1 ferredoxin--NADP reductase [Mucilaginibacter limnophilus]
MLQLRVEHIKHETADTATFYLREISGKKLEYQAGQFITLVFTHHEEEIRRSYSFSSSPDEAMPAITIKRIPNGEISRFMFSKVKVGDILNAAEPAGRFVVTNPEEKKDILFFAAGSGITPVFSQLKYLLKCPGKSNLILIYSSLSPASIIFKKELDELAASHPERLKIICLLSSDANRLNNYMAEQLVKKHTSNGLFNADFYLCGPFDYMRMLKLTLLYMHISPSRIRKENFVINTIAVMPVVLNYAPQKVGITFKGEHHDIMAGENQSILQAALQNNIPLPYSCRAGVCSACAVRCTSGKVEMARNDVLTDEDIADGWILTCTGHPVNAVEISV